MNSNGEILSILINEDYGLETKGNSRWGKSKDHSSLVLDKEKGLFYWNSRNIVGDPLIYLTKVRNYSFQEAKDYLNNFRDFSGVYVYRVKSGSDDVIAYPELVDKFHDSIKYEDRGDYFYRRGLSNETIDRFRLGWYNEYSMIPFFENNTFRNFQMRKDNPTKQIRSYYRGVGPLLYNSDLLKLTNKVYFTEGPIDALILLQNGLPAISTNSGGLMISDWYGKFIYQDKIYLVFDNDSAGIQEAKRVSKVLGQYRCKIYTFKDFEEKGYDPVDFFLDGYSKDDFIDLLENKSRYVFEI